jgi:serine/threonine-protein kinase RsbT
LVGKSKKNKNKLYKSLVKVEVIKAHTYDIKRSVDNENVVVGMREFAREMGFKVVEEVMIATASSELTTNIVRYAKTGKVIIREIKYANQRGIEIEAIDKGPGIPNIALAIEQKFTTTERSMGMGLSSVLRIMDETMITSHVGKGTRIVSRKWYR